MKFKLSNSWRALQKKKTYKKNKWTNPCSCMPFKAPRWHTFHCFTVDHIFSVFLILLKKYPPLKRWWLSQLCDLSLLLKLVYLFLGIQCLVPNATDKVHRQRNIQSIFGIVKSMSSAVGWNTNILWCWCIENITVVLNVHLRPHCI